MDTILNQIADWLKGMLVDGIMNNLTGIKGFRWDLLHGKRRKAVKYYLKKELRYEKHQLAVWNKYAGQKTFCISMPV